MSISLEQIDLLRKRANVSYQEAKEALEQCDNNIVEALIYLEKGGHVKTKQQHQHHHHHSKFCSKVKQVIKKGNETKVIIKGKEDTVLNMPLTLAALITIVATPVVVVGIPVALLTNHRIKIEKKDGEDMGVNKIFDKMSDTLHNMTENFNGEKKSAGDQE
ncbi:MAG: DUF4342 domain-containing protein [Thermotaleaceae bacterium]